MRLLLAFLISILCYSAICFADIVYEGVNENIIRKVTTTVKEIDLRKLRRDIERLEEEIEATPEMIEMPSRREELERERDEKVDYLRSSTDIRNQ